ncbi:MAG: NAD-dependent epimerase/dehydratase family protein [Polyangiaceae bacterium]|nr:NAD-dependent epimerase/dehydratase family protein [Polyangiaceae bacterium]
MRSRAGQASGSGIPTGALPHDADESELRSSRARLAPDSADAPGSGENGGGSGASGPELHPTTVAVTGSATFIGRHLIGLLEEDPNVCRILSIDATAPKTRGPKTSHFSIDLAHPLAESRLSELFGDERTSSVVHAAFGLSPSQDPIAAHELESIGTDRLLNACLRTRVRKVVLWSHTLLYGAHPTNPNFLAEHHPLRARRDEPFFANKIDAETAVLRFGRPGTGRLATVLRTAPILGPTVENYLTRFLGHRLVTTMLGFDPLWQFVHEADAVRAFKLALYADRPGVFNIVGDGVLPLSAVVRLAGRTSLPLPRSVGEAVFHGLWLARLIDIPPSFLDYLQYLCVADGARAVHGLGFRPVYTSREALLEFASVQRQREARLISEDPA